MTSRRERRDAQRSGRQAGGARQAGRGHEAASVRTPVRPPPLTLPRAARWVALAVVAATILAYAPALRGPFVMDDEDTIGASALWQAPERSPTAGRPLVMVTLAANHALNEALGVDQRRDPDGPNKAVGYRLVNVLLHLLTGALLFGVLRRAMRERTIPEDWRAIADPLAGAACALWLLHPIQSEVVNYIVQRSESMASALYLTVLYACLRAGDSPAASRLRWYVLAVVACALGMLSKEIVISAPLAVMLYDRAFRLPSWRALLRPGDGRGWVYAALWTVALSTFAVVSLGARGETAGFGGNVTWYAYLYTQCWAIAHYLRLVLWPSPLAIDYGFATVHGIRGIPGAVLLTAFGAATLVAWTRLPRAGWFALAGSMFFLLLAPSSSVVPVTSEIAAERRIYLALAVVLVLAVVTAEWLRRRIAARVPAKSLLAVAGALCTVFVVATAARSESYASSEALWRSAVMATPRNPRALGNLGWSLYKLPVPKLAEADSMYALAMAEDTTCHFGCLQYATVLAAEGRLAPAVPLLERELEVSRGSAAALTERSLGLVLMRLGHYDRAMQHLESVANQFPSMEHLVVFGVDCLEAGRLDKAMDAFRRVGSVDGGSAEMTRLSARLMEAGRRAEALDSLRQFAGELSRDWMN